MKFDVYTVINETKEGNLIDNEELDQFFSFGNINILTKIIAQEEVEDKKTDIGKLASIIVKNKDEYQKAKKDEKLDEFKDEINSKIKKEIKKNRKKVKKELIEKVNNLAQNTAVLNIKDDSPNKIIFKLFWQEYNNKYAFTWKAFKEVKKQYEKNNPLEGEDIYVLKSLLEKDPNITKVQNGTLFCKAQNTLSDFTIKKIKEKIEN